MRVLKCLLASWTLAVTLVLAQPVPAADPIDNEGEEILSGVDKVVVWKRFRILSLMRDGRPLVSYRISLGSTPVGHKQSEGDGRTPEGQYILDRRSEVSRFYRSIHISYPNETDRRNARQRGDAPGFDILIHGVPNDLADIGILHTEMDWTNGCIAVSNAQMDVIWDAVQNGTPIEIRP